MNYVEAANCIIAYGQLKIATLTATKDKEEVIKKVNVILKELYDDFYDTNKGVIRDIPDKAVYRRLEIFGRFCLY